MSASTAPGGLLGRFQRPHDPVRAVAALLGRRRGTIRALVGAVLATSDEVEDLLDAMPRILRSLSIATTDTALRCAGEIRGPVLWSETIAAQAAAAGDPGIVVCASPARAFDTVGNQVLVAALATVLAAGHDAEHVARDDGDVLVARARYNATRARRHLEHQALAALPRRRPDRRALARTRTGSRRATYAPALRVLTRARHPLDDGHLLALADEATAVRLDLLGRVLDALEGAGVSLPPLVVVEEPAGIAVAAGPLRYRHPALRATGAGTDGTDATDATDGIQLGTRSIRSEQDVAHAVAELLRGRATPLPMSRPGRGQDGRRG
jgi:hypothetical protein